MNVADWPLYFYRGTVLAVTDGDTFRARVDLGMRVYRETPIRLAGVDAPELRSSDPTERARGTASRLVLINILSQDGSVFKPVYLRTYLDKTSFDRYIADVWVDQGDGTLLDVAQEMVNRGMAIRSEWR